MIRESQKTGANHRRQRLIRFVVSPYVVRAPKRISRCTDSEGVELQTRQAMIQGEEAREKGMTVWTERNTFERVERELETALSSGRDETYKDVAVMTLVLIAKELQLLRRFFYSTEDTSRGGRA